MNETAKAVILGAGVLSAAWIVRENADSLDDDTRRRFGWAMILGGIGAVAWKYIPEVMR